MAIIRVTTSCIHGIKLLDSKFHKFTFLWTSGDFLLGGKDTSLGCGLYDAIAGVQTKIWRVFLHYLTILCILRRSWSQLQTWSYMMAWKTTNFRKKVYFPTFFFAGKCFLGVLKICLKNRVPFMWKTRFLRTTRASCFKMISHPREYGKSGLRPSHFFSSFPCYGLAFFVNELREYF